MTTNNDFSTFEDLPGIQTPAVAAGARSRTMKRHILATLRASSGKSLSDVATARGVSKAAVHQLENRPLETISIGAFLDTVEGMGFPVTEEWFTDTIVAALPPQSAHRA